MVCPKIVQIVSLINQRNKLYMHLEEERGACTKLKEKRGKLEEERAALSEQLEKARAVAVGLQAIIRTLSLECAEPLSR
jgi:hypothetical protein